MQIHSGRRGLLIVGAGLGTAVLMASCAGESTANEVCAAYETFAQEWFDFSSSDGFFDSAAFNAMEDLGDVAARYPDENVSSDGEKLKDLADGDGGFIVSVSLFEAENSSNAVRQLCS